MAIAQAEKPFNSIRWFTVLSLATIAVVCVLSSIFLSRFLTKHMLMHDAEVTMGFVESVAKVQKAAGYFAGRQAGDSNWEEFFQHLDDMPDVLRINAYAKDGKVIWSSDKSLIGKKFDDNDELENALKGNLVVDSGVTSKAILPKAEHIHLSDVPIPYVENYIPIRDVNSSEVIGVVELYRSPRSLYETLSTAKRYIWLGGLGSGLLLFAMLFWIMRRANKTIAQRRDEMVHSETSTTITELSGLVARGIRRPLASIRSSAQLIHDDNSSADKETVESIISEVDRVESWIHDLLNHAKPSSEESSKNTSKSSLKKA
jgi:two-component system, NtrC family, sensor histidine kinase HydH